MAVQVTSSATVITGDHIQLFRLLSLKQAMAFEVKTGMKMCRINPFNIAREEFGIKARKKVDVLEQFTALLASHGIG